MDALRSPWPPGLLYAFPPLAIISQVIRKMLDKEAELILVTPHWPRWLWFADLVALSVAPSRQADPQPRSIAPPRGWLAQIVRMEIERQILQARNLSAGFIATLQASHRDSTNCIYNCTWTSFCCWCVRRNLMAIEVSTEQVLEFLQTGLMSGLSPNTLQRQVAVLSSVLSYGGSSVPLTRRPLIRQFLQGATNPPYIGTPPGTFLRCSLP